jgi:hypothetical protein
MKRALIPVFLVTVAIVAACSDDEPAAQPKVFNLTLSPTNETPPCPDAGVNATGTATVTIPADNQSVVVAVTYSGLSGPATASHIHSGNSTAAGPVVLPFSAPLDSPLHQDPHRRRLHAGDRNSSGLRQLRDRAQGRGRRLRERPHLGLQARRDPRRDPVTAGRTLTRRR